MNKKILAIWLFLNLFLISIFPLSAIGNNLSIAEKNKNGFLEVEKIYFNWGEDSEAITLWDSETENPIYTPEYDTYFELNNPAAYIKGTKISVKAKFVSDIFSSVQIRATGTFDGLDAEDVTFQNGESDWIYFTSNDFSPDEIKNQTIIWNWEFYNATSANWEVFDITTHTIYLLNTEPIVDKIWKKLADWTSTWCTGLSDDMDIADAILNGFVETKYIKYGISHQPTVPKILRKGAGFCGDLSILFYFACGTQGVTTIKYAMILLPQIVNFQTLWHDMIILNPGLGRDDFFSDYLIEGKVVNDTYPYPKYYGLGAEDDDVDEYEFYAWDWLDHAINLFEYDGVVYLYDLSYGQKYENVFDSIPINAKKSSSEVPLFRANYFDKAVDFLQGKIFYTDENGNRYRRDVFQINTTIVPDKLDGKDQIMFLLNTFDRARDYDLMVSKSRMLQNPIYYYILEKFPIFERILSILDF